MKQVNLTITFDEEKLSALKRYMGKKELDLDREMTDALGMGIANICYVLNPEVVVLGGGIMAQKDYLKSRLENSLKNYLLPAVAEHTRLEFAVNGNSAGMLGAYLNFRERYG